jgi:hypothetical protein
MIGNTIGIGERRIEKAASGRHQRHPGRQWSHHSLNTVVGWVLPA